MSTQTVTPGSQVAAGRVPDVVVMENHDAAYEVWRSAGVRDRVVAHLDAHHDMWFIDGTTPITIANYLCPAVRDGMIKALFWIVPDPTWETPADRSEIVHQVKQIIKRYPGSRGRVRVTDRGIATSILGRPLTVGPLAALTPIDEPVLLDIDSDYLVVDHVYSESDAHRRLPWRWPDDLLNRLGDLGVVTDLVTIPYSVEGGYTPLRWKYLGDELAARLRGSDANTIRGFEALRTAALESKTGGLSAAERALLDAEAMLPQHPAPPYLLSELYAADGRVTEARQAYLRAIDRDPTYRTPYRTSGLAYFTQARYDDAEREYRRGLAIDPDDPVCRFGLAQLAAHRREWAPAEGLVRQALELDPSFVEAYRLLGDVLCRQGRYKDAIDAYHHSLLCALRGRRALDSGIATGVDGHHVADRGQGRVYARIGRAHAAVGNTAEAIKSFRASIAGRHDRAWIRWRLAQLYTVNRQWRAAGAQVWPALRVLGVALVERVGRIKKYRRRVRHWADDMRIFRQPG